MDKKKSSVKPTKTQAPPKLTVEHAEKVVSFVDYSLAQSRDLAEVLVAAEKEARALQLIINGLRSQNEHTVMGDGDFNLLDEMAGSLWSCCGRAKKLIAEGEAAAA